MTALADLRALPDPEAITPAPAPLDSEHVRLLLTPPSAVLDLRSVEPQVAETEEPRVFRVRSLGQVKDAQGSLFADRPKGAPQTTFSVIDALGNTSRLSVFGFPQPLFAQLCAKQTVIVRAKVFRARQGLLLVGSILVDRADVGHIKPVYRKQGDELSDAIRARVASLLDDSERMDEAIEQINHRGGVDLDVLCNKVNYRHGARALIVSMHRPLSLEHFDDALRIGADMNAQALFDGAMSAATARSAAPIVVLPASLDEVMKRISFTPTNDQRTAMATLVSFLESTAFRILLTGDVGTGKTLAFAAPLVAALQGQSTLRGAVLAPNVAVAHSIVAEISRIAPGQVTLCTAEEKPDLQKPVVVGTSALFALRKQFSLVVVDEMHKFSVRQREQLVADTGKLIEATATCVPRSQALLNLGASHIARLTERPFKRAIQSLQLDGPSARAQISELIQSVVAANGQVAMLYPSVATGSSQKGVMRSLADLRTHFGAQVVDALHGRMTDEEKNQVLQRMREGSTRILVCTTVIELGITLPSLKMVVVIDPDRHGLSTLHQVRGRIARHGGDGYFVLHHTQVPGELAAARAEILLKCDDGFEIAEQDLRLRGMGDLVGEAIQSGKAQVIFNGLTPTYEQCLARMAACEPMHRC
jgi:ATP-dependent DNA helicase RecG